MSKHDPEYSFGRPKIKIDERVFESLMGIPMITLETAADVLNVSKDTLRRWILRKYGITFATLKAQKVETMKTKVMAKQIELAMKGNVSMLIWLGKNWLGQADKLDQKISGDKDKPLTVSYSPADLKAFVEKKNEA